MDWFEAMSIGDSNKEQGKSKEALEYYQKALEIAKSIPSKKKEAWSLLFLGELYSTSFQNYREAIKFCEEGLAIVQEITDTELECKLCRQLGYCYQMLHENHEEANFSKEDGSKQALEYYQKALEIARSCAFKEDEVRALLLMGTLYNESITNYQDSIKYFEQGLAISKDIGNEKVESEVCFHLGQAYDKLEQYDLSIKFSKQALNLALKLVDAKLIADCNISLGNSFKSLCKYQDSIECLKTSMDYYEQLGDEQGLGICYAQLSLAYQGQGKYYDAIHFQEESLRIADKIGNEAMQASASANLANMHLLLNNPDKAINFYIQSDIIAEKTCNNSLEQTRYGNLGNIFIRLQKNEKAISYYSEQLKTAQKLNAKESQAKAHLNLGICFRNMEKYENAMEHFNKSLALVKEINAQREESLLYFNIAVLQAETGEFKEAISMANKSLDIALSIGDKEPQSDIYTFLGLLYYLFGKHSGYATGPRKNGNETSTSLGFNLTGSFLDGILRSLFTALLQDNMERASYDICMSKSEEYLKKALDCYEFSFTHLRHLDQLKLYKFDDFIKTYKLLTTVLIETQQEHKALLISDRGRARALGDRLTFAYGISQEGYLSSKPLTYPEVESVLSNDTFTVLHYILLEESLAVWVLTKDSMTLKEIHKEQFISAISLFGEEETKEEDAINRYLAATVARAYQDMKIQDEMSCENRSLNDMAPTDPEPREGAGRGNSEPALHPLEGLFNALIAPVLSHIQHDEIVIVPDGEMYTVPFAALKDPNTGKYLSESKRIRLAPSIAVLKLLQECTVDHHCQQGGLIVGNPSVGKVKLRGKKELFPPLLCALKEARAIADVIKEASEIRKLHPNITLLTETRATKDVVLAKMKEGTGIIHIAAHGDHKFGEILLAPITLQDSQDLPEEQDYLLTMKEVQEVGVKAQLVVLSCCHSGQGEVRAEGMVGLSRAFLAAGARAVVASLWAIKDKATYDFMVTFYESLCRGNSASVSLKHAVAFLKRHPFYSDPKYWAAFFLIGDDVTIQFGQ